ncbi:MAG: rhodanese-like domain-containing protein [Ekhidna sp.]|uniref:rhodanese-like domain-containing protein n=1 Tax=Ekhidna sp. TaxID=2608089 RepID=UPI0032EE1994
MLGLFSNKKKIKEYLQQGATIVDVRTKTEFEGGHLRNSVNIPLDSLPKHLGQLDKNKPIITCCASGMRSGLAKRMLKTNGFEVVNGGGWMKLQQHE